MKSSLRTKALGTILSAIIFTLLLILYACSEPSSVLSFVSDSRHPETKLESQAHTTPVTQADIHITPSPSQTPFYSTRLAEEQSYVNKIGVQALQFLNIFTSDYSPRQSATEQERDAAEFLARELKAINLIGDIQSFTVTIKVSPTTSFSISDPFDKVVNGILMHNSGYGETNGVIKYAGKALDKEINADDIKDNIALIERGTITFSQKVDNVYKAGAKAAVIYNNKPGVLRGRLLNQTNIPVITISHEDGESIKNLISSNTVQVSISVESEIDHKTRNSRNVISEIPGYQMNKKVVILGAHYDTTPNTQGANDNGSGIATLFTVISELTDDPLPFTLRIIAFGSEETGLHGSTFYVDSLSPEERGNILAMLNFDSVGSGDFIEVTGHTDLVGIVDTIASADNLKFKTGILPQGANSDHYPFEKNGIPTLTFFGNDLSRINSPEDTIEFVKPDLMGIAAVLGIGVVETMANR